MIIGALIALLGFLFDGLALVLPVGSLPVGIANALAQVGYALNDFTYILPVSDIFTALGIVIGYEGIIWGYHALLWFWKKLPFIGK